MTWTESTPIVIGVISFLGIVISAWISASNGRQLTKTHVSINSRMDLLIEKVDAVAYNRGVTDEKTRAALEVSTSTRAIADDKAKSKE